MKVVLHTNIDAYNEKRCLPEHLSEVPRKGEFIQVKPSFESYYWDKKLPSRLEVVSVTYKEKENEHFGGGLYETIVMVELWYNSTDLELARVSGGKPL